MTFQDFCDRIRILFARHSQWGVREDLQEGEIELSLHGEHCSHFLVISLEELYEQEEKAGWDPVSAALSEEMDAVLKAQRRNRSLGWQDHLLGEQKELFEKLRSRRAELAREKHVPPYVIFSNRTLYEMCRELPDSREEMKELYGVGEINSARYGEEFLQVIREFKGRS